MRDTKMFILFMLLTALFWYSALAFVNWDIMWCLKIPTFSHGARACLFIGIIVKTMIDYAMFFDGGINKMINKICK